MLLMETRPRLLRLLVAMVFTVPRAVGAMAHSITTQRHYPLQWHPQKTILSALSLALTLGCSASRQYVPSKTGDNTDKRIANLERAATLPWSDGGRCAAQEASSDWSVLVERCFYVLDIERIRFQDPGGRCGVATVGAAAVPAMVGMCLLASEIVIGSVIIVGAVVVATAITEELDELARCRQVAAACRERCSELLPTKDHGFTFFNCVNKCLMDAGCPSSSK